MLTILYFHGYSMSSNKALNLNTPQYELVGQGYSEVVQGVALHVPWERSLEEEVLLETAKRTFP